ncbi:MAG: hypothetical protein M3O70_07570 [Actinomycetota bacterium]|nr:hypothetical protein [Actinomycetota bacterium]
MSIEQPDPDRLKQQLPALADDGDHDALSTVPGEELPLEAGPVHVIEQ